MKAIFLILFVFSTFMLFLGYSAKTTQNNPLGNALIFGGLAIYTGMTITWILFKFKERGECK
ncbi:MAG: hypothetical protein ACR2MD_19355 [Aridibacter sp.]